MGVQTLTGNPGSFMKFLFLKKKKKSLRDVVTRKFKNLKLTFPL